MAGFLVPFLSGGLTAAKEIRNEYDETAGNIVDAASKKYNIQFDENSKAIELQNANYNAVLQALGAPMAEISAKEGRLNDVPTNQVVDYVKEKYSKSFIDIIQKKSKEKDKNGDLTFKLSDLGYQTLFSQDYNTATKSLKNNRDWAAKNINKGALKNVSDLYLDPDSKDAETSALGKAQSFMFGDRITEGTGVAFDQAASQEIGSEVKVQPTGGTDLKSSISDTIGFQETVYAGSINDINKAITSSLGLQNTKGFTIDPNNNFLFDTRFMPDANSIRANASDVAATYQFMSADGKPDTTKIVQIAHETVRRDIINPSLENFINPNITNKDIFNEKRKIFASGLSEGFIEEINNYKPENIISDREIVKGEKRVGKVRGGGVNARTLPDKEIDTGNFLVTVNVADVFIAEIKKIAYREDKLTYISYMADNFYVRTKNLDGTDAKMPLKDFVTETMGLKEY